MKAIQITFDEQLLDRLDNDEEVKQVGRSAGFLTLLSSGTTSPFMKTVFIVVDEQLLEQIDAGAHSRRRKRSVLFCEAARQWLKQQQLKARIRQDRQGYQKHPVEQDEFGPLLRAQQRNLV